MLPAAKSLSAATIFKEPRDFDFSEGYSEQWEYIEAGECSECGKVLVGRGGEEQHCDMDENSECEGYINCEGPMMNYYYPLDGEYTFSEHSGEIHGGCGSEEEAAKRIARLPLCIVRLGSWQEPEYALALTGGGMNLAWSIAEAYIRLGYLPPLHICGGLPDFSGDRYTRRKKAILAACNHSVKMAMQDARGVRSSLKQRREWLKSQGERRQSNGVLSNILL